MIMFVDYESKEIYLKDKSSRINHRKMQMIIIVIFFFM